MHIYLPMENTDRDPPMSGNTCAAPTPRLSVGDVLVLVRTGAASAALFSLLFVGDGLLAWFGLTGIIPILLYRAGCPSCSTSAGGSFQSLGPGH